MSHDIVLESENLEDTEDEGPYWSADYWRDDEDAGAPWLEPDKLPRFQPDREHERDFRWFFSFGPKPPKGLSKKNGLRYRRIKRGLDGYGYALQRYYTNRERFIDRRLAAAPLDPYRSEFRTVVTERDWTLDDLKRLDACRAGYVSSDDDDKFDDAIRCAVRALEIDYMRYLDNAGRHYAARREPHIVLTEKGLRRAIFWGGTILPRHRIEMRRTEGGDGPSKPIIVEEPGEDPEDTYHRLLAEGRIVRSTWGDWRVSEEAAAIIMLMPSAPPEEVFAQVQQTVQFRDPLPLPKSDPWHSPDDSEERRDIRESRKDAFASTNSSSIHGDDPGGAREVTGPWNDLYWERRHLELNVGKPTTTVRELGKRYGIDSARLRQLLIDHGCDEARIRNTPIPIAWLRTDAGERFKSAVGQIAGTFSGAPKRRRPKRNRFAFLNSESRQWH